MTSNARKTLRARQARREGIKKQEAIRAILQAKEQTRKQEEADTMASSEAGKLASAMRTAKGFIVNPDKGETHETLARSVARYALYNAHEGADLVTRRNCQYDELF